MFTKSFTAIAALALAPTVATAVATGSAAAFELTSPAIAEGATFPDQHILAGFGCSGGNVSPELVWRDPPAGTKSFAVTVYDPDAPTGSGWWHWVVFNIPPEVDRLAAGAGDPAAGKTPAGSVQGRTDFGAPGYGGPCPPAGDKPHRYVFTVFALKTDKLPLDERASGAMVGFFLNQNALATATLTGLYGR